ncbi:MAG: HEAT repeat domain-containing protein [Gemmatimonadetes bacterium]|nr:HEAT repeat domain-containing protein [Gemmatimonadota bacterium]
MLRIGLIGVTALSVVAGRLDGQATAGQQWLGPQARDALGSLAGLEGLSGLEVLSGLDALAGLEALRALETWNPFEDGVRDPTELAAQQRDPADSIYRVARQALSNGDYQSAAAQFEQVWSRYPRSDYAGDAMYWAAFALHRIGGTRNLAVGLQLLVRQGELYPDARTRRDARGLATRIQGDLARLGDPTAAESIAVLAAPPARPAAVTPPPGAAPARAPTPPAPARPPRSPQPAQPAQAPQACEPDEDAELRLEALSALLQMDAERAVPILREVLRRRDPCSVELRRRAVFLVSQKRDELTEETLLTAARQDPDREVRAQAVFWLSQVNTERAVAALDSILMGSDDRDVQEKAIFALSQHKSERAGEILRRYVERADRPDELKEKAIFWLGQHRSPQNQAFLRDLYPQLTSEQLKEQVIQAVSQVRGPEAARWLLDLARNANEPVEMRKKALFWAGQKREVSMQDLAGLYEAMPDRELKEQLIFAYSQRREPEAVDKLMSIAETEPDRELRKKAVFWLGQSKDPRAAEFLLRLINR